MNEMRSTAIHEAGHAVIARVMAQVCGDASIVPDLEEFTAGYAIIEDPWNAVGAWDQAGRFREIRSIMIGRIIASMAGRHAEEELIGYCPGGDDDDQHQIELMLGDLDGDSEALKARLQRFSRAAVRRHRGLIDALASKLLERNKLSGDEVDDLLRQRLPKWFAPYDHEPCWLWSRHPRVPA